MGEIITLFDSQQSPTAGTLIGEDTADLLIAIQDNFGVEFGDEGPFPKTVCELCGLVVEKLKGARTTNCLTSLTFYKVRRALIATLGLDRNRITPSARLTQLLAKGPCRRRQWKDLEWRTGLRFPWLTHPRWMAIGMLVIAAGLATRFAVNSWTSRALATSLVIVLLSWLLALVLWLVAYGMTQQVVWGLPRSCQTVGDLVHIVMAKNYGTLSEEAGGWNEKEVWKALRLFIADEISISPEKIAQDTPFPDGLNIW